MKPTPADPGGTQVVLLGTGWAVIDKPAGVLSVPGLGPGMQSSVATWARELGGARAVAEKKSS